MPLCGGCNKIVKYEVGKYSIFHYDHRKSYIECHECPVVFCDYGYDCCSSSLMFECEYCSNRFCGNGCYREDTYYSCYNCDGENILTSKYK